jgi:hypothetical protein
MPPGRPSKYDPKYCEMVVDDMSKGMSLTAFAGLIGVDRSTIDTWREQFPDFRLACTKGQAVRTRYLEGGMLERDMPGPAVNARRFALANAAPEEWREKQSLEHSGPNGGAIQTEVSVSVNFLTPGADQ